MNSVAQFLSGALMLAFLAISFFFYRFWRKTKDSLFAAFSASFFIMALERIVLLTVSAKHEWEPFVYLIRFSAFVLFAVAILRKNIGSRE